MTKRYLLLMLMLGWLLPMMAALPEGVVNVFPMPGQIYTIGGDDIDPASMSAAGAGVVMITFDADRIELNTGCREHAAIYVDGRDTPDVTLAARDTEVDSYFGEASAVLTFPGDFTAGGTYLVTVPQGMWLIGIDRIPTPAMRLVYRIDPPCNVFPPSGMITTLDQVTITFPFADDVEVADLTKIRAMHDSDPLGVTIDIRTSSDGRRNIAALTFADYAGLPIGATKGFYFIAADRGAFNLYEVIDGKRIKLESDAVEVQYRIADIPQPEIDPAEDSLLDDAAESANSTDVSDGESSGDSNSTENSRSLRFQLLLPQDFVLDYLNTSVECYIYALRDDYTLLPVPIYTLTASLDGRMINLEGVSKGVEIPGAVDGEIYPCELHVSEALFSGYYGDDVLLTNPTYIYRYYFVYHAPPEEPDPDDPNPGTPDDPNSDADDSGISDETSDLVNAEVYTLDGRHILTSATPSVLSHLSRGIYILVTPSSPSKILLK